MSPTARTLAKLRAEGWHAWVVEQTIPHTFIKRDMGQFADIVAWAPGRGILAVQCTSGSNVSARVAKIQALKQASEWVLSPARLEVWGWRKVGKRGKRKLWECRVIPIGAVGPVSDEVQPFKEAPMNHRLMLVTVLMLAATACSSSHHSSDGSTGVTSPWGEGIGNFGTWTCQDACGCQPPKDFSVQSWADVKANDLCGTPFNCHYRCSADCSCESHG